MWLLLEIHERWPWLWAWFLAAFLLAGILSCASITRDEVRPGLRVLAICPTEHGTMILAYPQSGTFAIQNVALGAFLGAALGAVGGPEAAAAGAGLGAIAGAVVEVAREQRRQPDPIPTCEAPQAVGPARKVQPGPYPLQPGALLP